MRASAIRVAKKRIEKLKHGGLDDDGVEDLVQDLVNRGGAVFYPLLEVLAADGPDNVEAMKPLLERLHVAVLLDLVIELRCYEDESRPQTQGERFCISALAAQLPGETIPLLDHADDYPDLVVSLILEHGPAAIPNLVHALAVLKHRVAVLAASEALGKFGSAAREAVPALLNVVYNGVVTCPVVAAMALYRIAARCEDVSFSIIDDLLEHDDAEIRNAAREAIIRLEYEDRVAKWETSESVAD